MPLTPVISQTVNIHNVHLLQNLPLGILFSILISISSYYLKLLTRSGAAAVFLLALIIYTFGGMQWTVPVFVFFLLSSLLSHLRAKLNPFVDAYFEKTGIRDYRQVIANGGPGGILVVVNYFFPSELYFYLYVSFVAAVCSDTWSTEIGTMFKSKTINIINFKEVPQGTSGGISLPGILGGAAGAFVIALSSLIWVSLDHYYYILAIVLAGISGNLADSFLGASFQVQYDCTICKIVTEKRIHCGRETVYRKGLKLLDNDIVNLSGGIAGALIFLMLKR